MYNFAINLRFIEVRKKLVKRLHETGLIPFDQYFFLTYLKVKKIFFAGIRHPLFVLAGSLFNQVLWFAS